MGGSWRSKGRYVWAPAGEAPGRQDPGAAARPRSARSVLGGRSAEGPAPRPAGARPGPSRERQEPAEAARPARKAKVTWPGRRYLNWARPMGPTRQGCRLSQDSARAEVAFPGGAGSLGPSFPRTLKPGLLPARTAARTLRQALGCATARFQTQGFQSHFEKAPEVFASNSDGAQHARCFGRNSIIVIYNKTFRHSLHPHLPQIFQGVLNLSKLPKSLIGGNPVKRDYSRYH